MSNIVYNSFFSVVGRVLGNTAVLLPMLLWAVVGQAQTITGGDFENLNACSFTPINSPFPSGAQHFHDGCVNSDFFVSHGTPEISKAFSDHWASLWANFSGGQKRSEGLFILCDFQPGQVYRLNFELSTYRFIGGGTPYVATSVDHVRFYLANGITPNLSSGAAGELPPNVPDKQLIFQLTNYSMLSWEPRSFLFMPDQHYEYLWIYPEQNDAGVGHLHIDNVSSSSCPVSQVYTNISAALPPLTGVSSFIEANGSVGPVTVLSGSTVHFRAGAEIRLLPGFEAQAGSVFSAEIAPCGSTDCAPSDQFLGMRLQDELEAFTVNKSYRKSSIDTEWTVRIYPNPADELLNIALSGGSAENAFVTMFDLSGKVAFSSSVSANEQLVMGTANFAPGVYVIEVTSKLGVHRERVVVH